MAGRKFPEKPYIARTVLDQIEARNCCDCATMGRSLCTSEGRSAFRDRYWNVEETVRKGELDALVTELARQPKADAPDTIDALLEDFRGSGHDMRLLYRDLIEPAARQLGDWWIEDKASGFEVTVALLQLQRSVRRLGAGLSATAAPTAEQVCDVLIASHPAEPSILGATLAGDVFRSAGWLVQVEFPLNDDQIVEAVRVARYDALVLLLGDLFCHSDQLDAIAACIAAARKSSRNRDVVVIAGGRVVLDQPDALAACIGADAAFTTAADALEKACDLLAIRRHQVAWRILSRRSMSRGGGPEGS